MSIAIQGDCIEIGKEIIPGSIDAIITDLPYGTTKSKWDIVIPFDDLWSLVWHVLKPGGVFVTTASQPFTSLLVSSQIRYFRDEWVLIKNRGGDTFNVKKRPLKLHESILVFCQRQPTYNPQGLIPETRKRTARKAGSVFYADKNKPEYIQNFRGYPTTILKYSITGKTRHPNEKSVALYEYLIRTYTNPGETVLDISAGSGTTGEAAIRTGRDYILIEKDPKYYRTIVDRLSAVDAGLF